MVTPMISGQMPIIMKSGGVKGRSPNKLKKCGRVGCRQVLDPAEEGGVAHLNGDEQNLIKGEEDRDLDDHGQAARRRVGLFALIKSHHFLVDPLLVLAEALAQL